MSPTYMYVCYLRICMYVTYIYVCMLPTFTQFSNTVPQSGHPTANIYKIKLKEQRFFTKRLARLQKMSYCNRLITSNSQSLQSRRLFNDLVLCYKLLHDNFDSSITTTLNLCGIVVHSCQNCCALLMLLNFILPIKLKMYGTIYKKCCL